MNEKIKENLEFCMKSAFMLPKYFDDYIGKAVYWLDFFNELNDIKERQIYFVNEATQLRHVVQNG